MLAESSHIAWLLTNDLCGRILDYSRTMHSRFRLRSNEVFGRLADAPDTCVALPCGAKELNNFRSEYGRVEEKPAFIEHSDTRLPAFARRPLRGGTSDQQTHRRLKAWVVCKLLHVEEQPGIIEGDSRGLVEKL